MFKIKLWVNDCAWKLNQQVFFLFLSPILVSLWCKQENILIILLKLKIAKKSTNFFNFLSMTRTHMSSPYFSQSKSNKRSKKSSLLIFISSDKNFSSSFIDCKSWKRVKHESLLIVLLLKWPEVSMDNQSCTSMPSEFILKVMHSMRHCERGRKRRAVNLWNPIRFSLNSIDSRASTYSNFFPPVFLFKPLSNTYTQETSNSLEWPLPDVFNSTWWAKKKILKIWEKQTGMIFIRIIEYLPVAIDPQWMTVMRNIQNLGCPAIP